MIGGGAVAFMRLGNHEDATRAADFIGRDHRFVLSQITKNVGGNESHTSTDTEGVGDSESTSTSRTTGTSRSWGTSRSSGTTYSGGEMFGLFPDRSTNYQRGSNRGGSTNTSDTVGTSTSTSRNWSAAYSYAEGTNWSDADTTQRVYEYAVEPVTLQHLPDHALLLVESAPGGGRAITPVECDPAIITLERVTTGPLPDPPAPQQAIPAPVTAPQQWATPAAPSGPRRRRRPRPGRRSRSTRARRPADRPARGHPAGRPARGRPTPRARGRHRCSAGRADQPSGGAAPAPAARGERQPVGLMLDAFLHGRDQLGAEPQPHRRRVRPRLTAGAQQPRAQRGPMGDRRGQRHHDRDRRREDGQQEHQQEADRPVPFHRPLPHRHDRGPRPPQRPHQRASRQRHLRVDERGERPPPQQMPELMGEDGLQPSGRQRTRRPGRDRDRPPERPARVQLVRLDDHKPVGARPSTPLHVLPRLPQPDALGDVRLPVAIGEPRGERREQQHRPHHNHDGRTPHGPQNLQPDRHGRDRHPSAATVATTTPPARPAGSSARPGGRYRPPRGTTSAPTGERDASIGGALGRAEGTGAPD